MSFNLSQDKELTVYMDLPLLGVALILAYTTYQVHTIHSQPLTVPVLWNGYQVYLAMRYKYIKLDKEGRKRIQALVVLLEDVTKVKNQHFFGLETNN